MRMQLNDLPDSGNPSSQPFATGTHHSQPVANVRVPSNYLTVATARLRYVAAGFPRTEKAIQNYCKNGTLTKFDDTGPNGKPKFFIDPASIERHLEQLVQLHHIDDQRGEQSRTNIQPDANRSNQSPPVANGSERSLPENRSSADANGSEELRTVANVREAPRTEKASDTPAAADSTIAIFEHPYVQRLQKQLSRTEDDLTSVRRELSAQHALTQQLLVDARKDFVQLTTQSQIGQSRVLSDFMLRIKNRFTGDEPATDRNLDDSGEVNPLG